MSTSEFLKKATLFLVLVVLVMFTICLDSLIAESLTKERVFAMWKVSKCCPLFMDYMDMFFEF